MTATHESTPFSLITTVLFDPTLEGKDLGWNGGSAWPFFEEHIDRLRNGAIGMGWEIARKTLEGEESKKRFRKLCEQGVEEFEKKSDHQAVAVRFTLDKDGTLAYTTFAYERRAYDWSLLKDFDPTRDLIPLPEALFRITVDTECTPSSVFTLHKTSRRPHYDAARARARILDRNDKKETILWNSEGEVTEGTYTNVYFWRKVGWVTPRKESGCLPGIARAWLLENGHAREGTIRREEVLDGEIVLLSNALYIAQLGQVQL